ncbi:MAG: hypothetical protein Q8M95_09825 [Candidatus Methanoperedens sp.]|nr:hypothetical protein [Candidatus Methanoperedens sp.]
MTAADSPEHREREQGADIRASFTCGQAIISGVAINTPTLVRIRKRLTSDVRGRSKDAPLLWAAQRKYEEKHERADEEMDVGV